MNRIQSGWYVRTPDGRTVKAASSESVRHHLRVGTFSPASVARKKPHTPWVPLSKIGEFADLPGSRNSHDTPHGVGSRLDPHKLHTFGVRGAAGELLAALDDTLVRGKLMIACWAAVGLMTAGFLFRELATLSGLSPGVIFAAQAVGCLLVLAPVIAVLTRLTHTELSMMRPAAWEEGVQGLRSVTPKLLCTYFLIPGVALAALLALREAPGWVMTLGLDAGLAENAATAAWGLALLVRVFLWVAIGVAGLLAPIAVIEECSVVEAMRQWARLIRENFGRLFLYEAMAVALGVVVALPLALPLYLAYGYSPPPFDNLGAGVIWSGLQGLAGGVFLAYYAVANVFIYLNLRYEYSANDA